jgi:hypothetical protein
MNSHTAKSSRDALKPLSPEARKQAREAYSLLLLRAPILEHCPQLRDLGTQRRDFLIETRHLEDGRIAECDLFQPCILAF